MKRKADDAEGQPISKAPRIEQRPTIASNRAPPPTNTSTAPRPVASGSAPSIPYRGSARPSAPVTARPTVKAAAKPASNAPQLPALTTDVAGAAKPKRGFAAALEKAKAAQEAAKTTGMIKHKPVEKVTKRDRLRMQQEALEKQKLERGKGGKLGLINARSKSAEPADRKSGSRGKEQLQREQSSYKGTMRPAPKDIPVYKGTMRNPGSGPPRLGTSDSRGGKSGAKPKDKYAGYASWSDLDDEDPDDAEQDYESGSSDMEAGLDDVEEEEQAALRLAKREDMEALKEEERLRREKLERKAKLERLSKAAASQKKRF